MTEKTPPTYQWTVSLADGSMGSVVDAAYPVVDDGGHMLLKDSDHKIVFAAAPGTGCTFTRGGLAAPAPAPITVTKFPDGCTCTYVTVADFLAGAPSARWERKLNWACKASHEDIDRVCVLTADSGACPHGYPPTVRCHKCSPVPTAG